MTKPSTAIDYEARIGDVLAFLAAHAHEDVRPARLAKLAHFSPHHFHRIFRGVSGESVMECVRRLRLESAALRLRRSRATVTEVALDAGFQSHEGFTRAFKERFGAPPAVWRRQASARVRALAARAPLVIPDVEVRTSPALPFVFASHRGSFSEVSAAWQSFVALAIGEGIFAGSERLLGRYPDDPEITPPGKVRFDVGLVARELPRKAIRGLRHELIPPARWAIAIHRGSYSTLSETYLRLVGGWFPKHGHALADRPCLELYLNGPDTTAEEDLETEVWAPLA